MSARCLIFKLGNEEEKDEKEGWGGLLRLLRPVRDLSRVFCNLKRLLKQITFSQIKTTTILGEAAQLMETVTSTIHQTTTFLRKIKVILQPFTIKFYAWMRDACDIISSSCIINIETCKTHEDFAALVVAVVIVRDYILILQSYE